MPVPMHPRALHVADILLGAEKTGHDLAHWLDSAAGGANAWTEHLAQSVLERIREQIRIGAPVGGAMADALARAATAAAEFSREHPEFLTILALGALMVLAPWVLETLGFWVLRAAGFAAKGPVAGEPTHCTHRRTE
jgi:hypothetical protein